MTLLFGICLIVALLVIGTLLWPVTFPLRFFRYLRVNVAYPEMSAALICDVQPMTVTLAEPTVRAVNIHVVLDYKEEDLPRVPLYEPPADFSWE